MSSSMSTSISADACAVCAGGEGPGRDAVDAGPSRLTRTARRLSIKARKSSGSKLPPPEAAGAPTVPPTSPKQKDKTKKEKS